METTEASTYEPPVLHELGTVHDLTEGPISGAQADAVFPHQPISV
ncbi:MAG TPA: lasso RiPP family leader peptide-containing protein [Gaiellaceae bacterium]|jgi:hypothetical protein